MSEINLDLSRDNPGPSTTKDRFYQVILIASTFSSCWLGMQIVHELGHVAMARVCGETIHKVVLHPLEISRTDASHDRHPLLCIWAGPVLGSMLPVVLLAVARRLGSSLVFLLQFFAGFCLITNGAYLGVGCFVGVGDAGDLLNHGSPLWTLFVFGLVCVPGGFWLWNGLGSHFGLGQPRGKVDQKAVRWASGLLLTIVAVEVLVGSR